MGVGLNLHLPDAARQSLDQAAFDLQSLGYAGDRNALLAAILAELSVVLPEFEQRGFAPLAAEWEARHAMQDGRACLHLPNGDVVEGIARGVAPDGALRFETPDGERRVHAGEVSLRRAA
jgi:BirA family biotin operon repressor/biotin-[acetyl-CoA-carboxylase] ligase